MYVNGFSGDRLQLAREFRGLTQIELGKKVVASSTLISLLERNKKQEPPSDDLVAAFSEVLDFKPSFFYQRVTDPFEEAECNFRHRRTAPEKLKSRVRAHATLLGEVVNYLRLRFRFPTFDMPVVRSEDIEGVEKAAQLCREHWRLGRDNPVLHIGRVVERAGVPIITGVVEAKKVDAFSRKGPTTLVFLNQFIKSPSRWAFDIAHECGHLVLHDGIQTGDKLTEAQADRFASALLLPEQAFRREFGISRKVSWPHMFELKRRWGVSVSAIIRRAYDLQLIDAVTYRRSHQYLSMKRWNTGEPEEPSFKEPELFVPALQALGVSVKTTIPQLCDDLGYTPKGYQDITGQPFPIVNTPKQAFQSLSPKSDPC